MGREDLSIERLRRALEIHYDRPPPLKLFGARPVFVPGVKVFQHAPRPIDPVRGLLVGVADDDPSGDATADQLGHGQPRLRGVATQCLGIDQRHPDTDELSLEMLPGRAVNPPASNSDASEKTPTRRLTESLYKVGVR